MDLVGSDSCSFALKRSYCDLNKSECENLRQFGFSKLVDDLMTKRNIFCKCCSTLSSNSRDEINGDSNVVTVDLDSDQDEEVNLQKVNVINFKELMLTLESEVEKRFESINLEFRKKLVEEKEKNIGLKEKMFKIREEFIPMQKYNDLKEFYEKQIRDFGKDKKVNLENTHQQFTSPVLDNLHQEIESGQKMTPMNDVEYNMKMDELRENLEKEYEKRLFEQRIKLEKENELKLNQLRTELAQYLVISTDKEVQTDNGINNDDEPMTDQNNNSQKSPEISETVDQRDNRQSTSENHVISSISQKRPMIESNCSQETSRQLNESSSSMLPQKKRERLSTHLKDSSPAYSESNLIIRSSSSLVSKTLKKVNGELDCYEIPWDHLPVRICTKCQWIEKIMAHDYSRHFKVKHNSVNLGEETVLSQFKEVIINNTMYDLLIDKKSREELNDKIISLYCYNIPEDYLFVQICSICQWVQIIKNYRHHHHFREHHSTLDKEESVASHFTLAVMEKSKYNSTKKKWKLKNTPKVNPNK